MKIKERLTVIIENDRGDQLHKFNFNEFYGITKMQMALQRFGCELAAISINKSKKEAIYVFYKRSKENVYEN